MMELWKKQKKILTAFALFLVFMFFCTLVSRAVYASKLPQVTTETPRRMAVNHTVHAEGIVHQGREYAVTALSGLRVRTTYVNVGDHVTEQTLLFDLDMEDLKKKIQDKELEIRKLQLQIAAMEQNRNLDVQKQQTENARAQEDYVRAQEKAGEDLERAREDLEQAEDAYDAHKDSPVSMTSEEDRAAAQAAYEEWTQKEASLRQQMEEAKKAYEQAAEDVKKIEEEEKNSGQQDAKASTPPDGETDASDGTGQGQPDKDTEADKTDGGQPQEEPGEDKADGADSGRPAKEPETDKTGGADSSRSEDGMQDHSLSDRLHTAREAEKKAKEAYDAAAAAYESHMADPAEKPDFSAEDAQQSAWEEKKESLKDAVGTAERAVEDAERSQSSTMLDAGRKVEDSVVPSGADSSLEVSRLELASLQTELDAYKKVQDASGQVYPEAEGIVTRIQVSPGERVGDGAAIVYADLSSPLQFQVSLTKEQKKYVNQGDTAELTLGSSSGKDLTVDYVAENDMNPELYDARIFLPDGVGTLGQSGSFKVEAQSETFSCCIPLNALYEDSSQRNFVYVVSERAGILGTEIVAEKVYVKVLDKNESYAALEEGVIDRETEVIVSSTEALEDRDVIRYRE